MCTGFHWQVSPSYYVNIYPTEILSGFRFGSLFINQEQKRLAHGAMHMWSQRPLLDATDLIKMALTMAVLS